MEEKNTIQNGLSENKISAQSFAVISNQLQHILRETIHFPTVRFLTLSIFMIRRKRIHHRIHERLPMRMRRRIDRDHCQCQRLCVCHFNHLETGAGKKFLGHDHRTQRTTQIRCNVLLDQAEPNGRIGQQRTEAGGFTAGNIIIKKGRIFLGKTEIFIPDF